MSLYWKRTMFAVVAVALFAAGFAGTRAEAKKVSEYRIGAILSVTGKASFLGDPEKKTLLMLAEELNKKGGINGIPVRVIVEDDQGDENQTKMAAYKLIDRDEVLVILGPSRSGNSMAVKALMGEKKVPMLSMAAAEAIVEPLNMWVFKTPQKDSQVAENIFIQMKKDGIKSVAVLYDNTGFGQEGFKQLSAFAPKYKINIVMSEAYEPSATEGDFETLLTKVKAKGGVQAVINWSILPSQSIVPKKMKDLKMGKTVLYQSHGFGNIKYVRAAGKSADGTIFPAGRLLVADDLPSTNVQKKVLQAYKKNYEGRYKEDISTFGGHAYDAFWIAVNAIKKAGADRGKIRNEIEKTRNFVGTAGVFNMSKTDHTGLGMDALEMLSVKNGEFTTLAKARGK